MIKSCFSFLILILAAIGHVVCQSTTAISQATATTVTIVEPPTTTSTFVVTALVTALTTVFTPPCGPVIFASQMDVSTCLAPGMSSVWVYGGYYSPGVCPYGYTTDCVRTEPREGELVPLTSGETAALCVPNGWSCLTEVGIVTNLAFSSATQGGAYTAPAIDIRWRDEDGMVISAAYFTETTASTELISAIATTTSNTADFETHAASVTIIASLALKPSTTFATFTTVTVIPYNSSLPHVPSPHEPPSKPHEQDKQQDTMSSGELSGIVFGVCAGLLALMFATWCVMKHWEENGCLSSCCGSCSEPRQWHYYGSRRIYSPSMSSEASTASAAGNSAGEVTEGPEAIQPMQTRQTESSGQTLVP